jgi:hypothetical protein
VPENIDNLSLRAYDQGLGRSFWYIAQGEVDKLLNIINSFSEDRHHDMWRGIGIAVTYVGGVKKSDLLELMSNSGKFSKAFKCGIALVSQTREEANALSKDTEEICKTLIGLSTLEVSKKLIEIENETKATPEYIYFDWLKNIESII